MSRIGKRPIALPSGVTVSQDGNVLTVKGPKGEISKSFNARYVNVTVGDAEVAFEKKGNTKEAMSHWGTYASHMQNMVTGVSAGFTKKLIIEGVGYRAEVRGNAIVLNLGYSHPVELEIPTGVAVTVEKNVVTITGFDKEVVGQFAALVRKQRPPEPYKGKGIRYDDEVVRRKEGKKSV